ncbi:MAG: hypothetical protein KGO96_07280 [Elusimicrobia bacterium]|nr:hypothetical protein [Elusimicrobiota bacterium]
MKSTIEKESLIIFKYKNGQSIPSIAKEEDIAMSTVSNILIRNGIPRSNFKVSKEEEEIIAKLYKDGKTWNQIKEETGRSKKVIRNVVLENNLQTLRDQIDETKRINKCKEFASKKDGEFSEINRENGKYIFKCKIHGPFETSYESVVYHGCWCRICALDPNTIEDCHQLAASRKGKFLSNEYINSQTRYLWGCDVCNNVWKNSYANIKAGQWCKICAINNRRITEDDFKEALKNLNKNGEFLELVIIKNKTLGKIQCNLDRNHIFIITYTDLKRGRWCKWCANNVNKTKEDAIKLAESRGFEFKSDVFKNVDTKYPWNCGKHPDWEASYDKIRQGEGCPYCSHNISKGQLEVAEYIVSLIPNENVLISDRSIIPPKELDIYIPSLKFAIEYNGLVWHSSRFKKPFDMQEHRKKFLACREKGIKLFSFYEDEWENKKDLIKAMIRYRLGKFNGTRLYARNLELRKLTKNIEFESFFNRNHIDGHAKAKYAYGLFYENKLVLCCSVRKNFNGETEIARLAGDMDYSIVGGASKLIKKIKSEIGNESLITFSNNRIGLGETYKKMGFELVQENSASYWYTDGKVRIWRYRCRRINEPEILAKFPTEVAQAEGGVFAERILGKNVPLYKISDFGHQKWKL